jgi:hypothetical protein
MPVFSSPLQVFQIKDMGPLVRSVLLSLKMSCGSYENIFAIFLAFALSPDLHTIVAISNSAKKVQHRQASDSNVAIGRVIDTNRLVTGVLAALLL